VNAVNQANRSTAKNPNSSLDRLASSAQETIASGVDSAQELASDQYDNLTTAIRRNPLQAALIAAGLGFVLALLVRR
jgi:ElaB/YqjD/DUF883 family membrane-anchored ribosome-binding protein